MKPEGTISRDQIEAVVAAIYVRFAGDIDAATETDGLVQAFIEAGWVVTEE